MKDKLSIIIPSRNNYEFVVSAYESLRKNLYYDDHQIIIYDDGDDGTYNKMGELKKYSGDNHLLLLNNETDEIIGTGQAMNICSKVAIHDKLMLFHADMYVSPYCDLHIIDTLNDFEKNVVSLTRIEPPLHPEGDEKIVKDFGLYVSEFKEEEFLEYVKEISKTKHKKTQGVFAPWAINKTFYNEIGGHDPQFNRYHEDTDIFYRMKLNKANFIQLWNCFVYHYTCRANKFANGVDTINPEFEEIRHKMLLKFIRKWKLLPTLDSYSHPVISSSYEKIKIKGILYETPPNEQLFELLSYLCDRLELKNKDIPKEDVEYDVIFTIKQGANMNYLFQYFLSILPYIYQEYDEGEYSMENIDLEIIKNK